MQTFSLPLAAAMGGCSFEAYNAPYVLHGVKEVSPCKTETVYMDRGFMDKLVAGVMEARLPFCPACTCRGGLDSVRGTARKQCRPSRCLACAS